MLVGMGSLISVRENVLLRKEHAAYALINRWTKKNVFLFKAFSRKLTKFPQNTVLIKHTQIRCRAAPRRHLDLCACYEIVRNYFPDLWQKWEWVKVSPCTSVCALLKYILLKDPILVNQINLSPLNLGTQHLLSCSFNVISLPIPRVISSEYLQPVIINTSLTFYWLVSSRNSVAQDIAMAIF